LDDSVVPDGYPRSGIWIGAYGGHGSEFVMIHYSENRLLATKITGDVNVPRGAISFSSDMEQKFTIGNTINPQLSDEFRDCAIYYASGTIAQPAFLFPQSISIDRTIV
jgi:hypothetical protein